MGKVKLNLASGAIVEKPLICAFKANESEYVVLDEEMNGSMGLPIILVCKYLNNKLTKILDQSEWQTVKECLKNIIAGGQIEFIKLGSELPADDIYYTQLTLPVPSFDALKNAYKVENDNSAATPVTQAEPPLVNPTTPNPTIAENKVEETGIMDLNLNNVPNSTPTQANVQASPEVSTAIPDIQIPIIEKSQAVEGTPNTQEINPTSTSVPNTPQAPIINNSVPGDIVSPTPAAAPAANVGPVPVQPAVTQNVNQTVSSEPISTPISNVNSTPVAPMSGVSELGNPTPVVPTAEVNTQSIQPVEPTPTSLDPNNKFKEQKEAFMQACENMFDALVQKFEKELENNKQS